MKINIIVPCLMMVTASSAHADDYTNYAECGAYFGVSAVMTKLSENNAPDYARDKYEKRYQFFLQGDNKLKRLAKNNPQYNAETFDKLEKGAMDKIFCRDRRKWCFVSGQAKFNVGTMHNIGWIRRERSSTIIINASPRH